MNEREYHRLRKEAKNECQRKLEAIDLVWQLSTSTNPPGGKKARPSATRMPHEKGAGGQFPVPPSHGQVRAAVLEALNEMGPRFTTRDVAAWIESHQGHASDRSTISHALKRLQAEGKLILIEAGKGKRPTRYEKKTDNLESDLSHPEAIGEQLKQQIRELAKRKFTDAETFKKVSLLSEYGATKLSELSAVQGLELMEMLRGMKDIDGSSAQPQENAGLQRD